MDIILNNFNASKTLLIQASVVFVVFWLMAKRLTQKTNYIGRLLGNAGAKVIFFVWLGFCLTTVLVGDNYGMIFLRLVPLALIFISVVKYRQVRSMLNQKLEE